MNTAIMNPSQDTLATDKPRLTWDKDRYLENNSVTTEPVGEPSSDYDNAPAVPSVNGTISEKPAKNPLKQALNFIKGIGALTVVTAMGLFLFEGLHVAGDVQRFYTISGFGVLLTVLGLAVYHGLKDRVASRLFLGLSLASVPLVAAVLGGLIFSLTDGANQLSIPDAVRWTLTDTASLYLALPIGALAIGCIAAFGFMVLARTEWRWMTLTLIATNALMLLPIRGSLAITLLALTSISAVYWLIKNKTNNLASIKTLEGTWALGMLFVAPIVAVGRTALIYDQNPLMIISVATLLFIGTRQWLNRLDAGSKISLFAAMLSFIFAAFAIVYVSAFAVTLVPGLFQSMGNANQWQGVIAATLFLAVQLDVTRKNPEHFLSKIQSVLTCFFAGLVFVQPYSGFGQQLFPTLVMLAPAIGFSVLHWRRGNRVAAGILTIYVIAIAWLNGENFLNFVSDSGWWGLAVAGSAIIVGGAVLERTLSRHKTEPETGSMALEAGH